jgi:hypothetical protein
VLQANLEMASGLTSDDPLLLVALGSKGASEDFSRQMNFTETYMMLSILHASRSIPVHAHGAGFDVKDAQADVIARVFAMAGLGLTLSRLVAREIWRRSRLFSVSCASNQHARLRRSSAKRFCGECEALDPGFE